MLKNINCITIIITLEWIEKIKTEKMATKQSKQSHDCLLVEWLLFSLNENINILWFNSILGSICFVHGNV